MRFMDDGRIFCQPLKRDENSLIYSRRWELVDMDRSQLDVTSNDIKMSMNGVTNYLEFTYETGCDYEDGWVPTLDANLVVSPTNHIW